MKILKGCLIAIMMIVTMFCFSGCNNSNNNTSATGSSTKRGSSSNSTLNNVDFVANAEKQLANPEKGETIAIIHVKGYGDIKVKFFPDVAPKAVENFITHSKEGYYNGVIFHRVINDFMIQGGDPTGTGSGGKSIWGTTFEDEFSNELVPYRGALCMANAGSNTNGSQFFIEQARFDETTYNKLKSNKNNPESILEAYKKYGGSMHLFNKHTVFGQVFEGMDVVDKIAATETNENDKPVKDVVIESIEIVEY